MSATLAPDEPTGSWLALGSSPQLGRMPPRAWGGGLVRGGYGAGVKKNRRDTRERLTDPHYPQTGRTRSPPSRETVARQTTVGVLSGGATPASVGKKTSVGPPALHTHTHIYIYIYNETRNISQSCRGFFGLAGVRVLPAVDILEPRHARDIPRRPRPHHYVLQRFERFEIALLPSRGGFPGSLRRNLALDLLDLLPLRPGLRTTCRFRARHNQIRRPEECRTLVEFEGGELLKKNGLSCGDDNSARVHSAHDDPHKSFGTVASSRQIAFIAHHEGIGDEVPRVGRSDLVVRAGIRRAWYVDLLPHQRVLHSGLEFRMLRGWRKKGAPPARVPQLEGVRGEELVVQVKERLGILPQVGRDILKIEAKSVARENTFVLVIPNPYLEHR